MGLKEYKRKRKFESTPEPKGKVYKKTGLKFVVQKHAARRLHYDLRLECDGVLKSWAVPKGPSMDPSVKRLAIQVEDHPIEYGTFEGTIPAGEYGAGEVIVWDNGTYSIEGFTKKQTEDTFREGLEKGEIKFTLHGKKLKGDFVLVKLHRSEKNEWLLFKKSDEFSGKEEILSQEKSVLSNKVIGKAEAMPHHIKPMLAFLIDKPFNDPNWIYEIKWDGFRAIAEISKEKVDLYSRNLKPLRYPTIINGLSKLKGQLILDGEIVVLDDLGRSNFQLLQNSEEHINELRYCVFDVLYYNGKDLRDQPLLERKKILAQILKNAPENILYSDFIEKEGVNFFKEAKKIGLEGIIAKDSTSHYTSKRSRSWLKIKALQEADVVIGGFTAPRTSGRKFGALLVGIYKNRKLIYAGHVGGGFDTRSQQDVYDKLRPLVTTKCPFVDCTKTNMPATWVKPKLKCEVWFQEWTSDGSMRQPIFHGLK